MYKTSPPDTGPDADASPLPFSTLFKDQHAWDSCRRGDWMLVACEAPVLLGRDQAAYTFRNAVLAACDIVSKAITDLIPPSDPSLVTFTSVVKMRRTWATSPGSYKPMAFEYLRSGLAQSWGQFMKGLPGGTPGPDGTLSLKFPLPPATWIRISLYDAICTLADLRRWPHAVFENLEDAYEQTTREGQPFRWGKLYNDAAQMVRCRQPFKP